MYDEHRHPQNTRDSIINALFSNYGSLTWNNQPGLSSYTARVWQWGYTYESKYD